MSFGRPSSARTPSTGHSNGNTHTFDRALEWALVAVRAHVLVEVVRVGKALATPRLQAHMRPGVVLRRNQVVHAQHPHLGRIRHHPCTAVHGARLYLTLPLAYLSLHYNFHPDPLRVVH